MIRPGRVDVKEYIGYCTEYQIVKMYEKFYPNSGSDGSVFASEVIKKKKPVSPAQLQGFFIMHEDDNIKTLVDSIDGIWNESGKLYKSNEADKSFE